jgi:ribonuclease G
LLELGRRLKPKGAGLILRTLAAAMPEKDIMADVAKLNDLWQEIEKDARGKIKKGLLYGSSDPVSRLLRETIDETVDEIIADNGDLADRLRRELKEVHCAAWDKVRTDLKGKLFERYGVNNGIREALRPKVQLPGGGYLVIEQTESLVAIDVNSGKYTGRHSLRETLLTVNLEAAAEITRQLRLRNLSGIIIIDFIDMEDKADWEKLLSMLREYTARDKAKSIVFGLTNLGLIEMSRKKEGQTLAARYADVCASCLGRGFIPK